MKDAFVNVCDLNTYLERINQMGCEIMPPDNLKKMIEGAVEFAARYGIEPHKDFQSAFRYLHDVNSENSEECIASYKYGLNGMPHFIRGPYDSNAMCENVIQTLKETAGIGNFTYDLDSVNLYR